MKFSELELANNFDEKNIEVKIKDKLINIKVKTYLPIEEKIKLLENVINNSADDMHFYNSIKLDMFLGVEILYNYTDLEFTEEEQNNIVLYYDQLLPIINAVIKTIENNSEYSWLHTHMYELVDSIYKYNNSILGIIDHLTTDYVAVGDKLEKIQENLADPKSFGLVKDILTKLG